VLNVLYKKLPKELISNDPSVWGMGTRLTTSELLNFCMATSTLATEKKCGCCISVPKIGLDRTNE
jgi:hypothetical protein